MELSKENRIIGLSPMAGFTDSSFRSICREFGADLVYTEMVSARGLTEEMKSKGDGKSLQLVRFNEVERPVLVQIFGNEPGIMGEAAKIICEKFNTDGIDINMGCPARKVIANDYGSSLLKEPELAAEIVRQVKNVVGERKLTVKTRLGWDNEEQILDFAPMMEKAGADMIAIHARTKAQGFSGEPNYEKISEVKKLVKIPVLANGGIKNWQDIDKCLEISKADGVLIGQAAIGRPWIFHEYKEQRTINFEIEKVFEIAWHHYSRFMKYSSNFNEIKKHLVGYFKGFPNASELRRQICLAESREELEGVLRGKARVE